MHAGGRDVVSLYDRMTGAGLSIRKTPAEFINVVVCLSEESFSGLPHFGHDRIDPYFN